jgi:hypothetical protein
MADPRRLLRRSAGYFAVSTFSSIGLFLLFAWAATDIARAVDLGFRPWIVSFALLGLLLSLEDYAVAIFAPASRNDVSGKLREFMLLAIGGYLYAMLFQFLRTFRLSPVPDGASAFLLVWGTFYWFSHSTVFYRFTSRIDIARLLEARRGEELTRLLQDERLFVLGSFKMMQASIRAASFRLFMTAVILITYSAEIFPLPWYIQAAGAVSAVSQLILAYVSRMYGEDHRFLAWGALPADAQRSRRSALIVAMLAGGGILALPFLRNRSLIAPEPVLRAIGSLFERMNAPQAVEQLNRLRFMNPGPSAPPTWGEYANQAPGSAASWYFAFMDNLIRVSLIALGIYLLILPILRDPRILKALLAALRSSGLRSALGELALMARLWFAGFGRSIWLMVSFPFRAVRSLLASFGGKRRRSRTQSENEQRSILKSVISRSAKRSIREAEKEREIRTLAQVFTSLVLLAGRFGLEIRGSDTVREIGSSCETTLIGAYRNSDSEQVALSRYSPAKIGTEVTFISRLFEESLFSGHPVSEEAIARAREYAGNLKGLFSAAGYRSDSMSSPSSSSKSPESSSESSSSSS